MNALLMNHLLETFPRMRKVISNPKLMEKLEKEMPPYEKMKGMWVGQLTDLAIASAERLVADARALGVTVCNETVSMIEAAKRHVQNEMDFDELLVYTSAAYSADCYRDKRCTTPATLLADVMLARRELLTMDTHLSREQVIESFMVNVNRMFVEESIVIYGFPRGLYYGD